MITATQCRCARTLLRWSVSKLSSAALVSQSAIHDFELERRQPNAITTDAIQRAFEDVGVVFLSQDDVQFGATCRQRGNRKVPPNVFMVQILLGHRVVRRQWCRHRSERLVTTRSTGQ
jgi:hypothetical protein